jgi:hypothetical protein
MKNGRCRMHGGKSLRGKANPRYRHGYYTLEAMQSRQAITSLLRQSRRTIEELG